MQQNFSNSQFDKKKKNSNKIILGRYRLVRSLGKGSFGQVFLADDMKFKPPRTVAIKLLHPQFLYDVEILEDIEREASILARLDHPNILTLYDFEVTEDLACIVMKYIEGGSLAERLTLGSKLTPARLPFTEVDQYLRQLSDALDYAHSHGLIHRDIKPLNILLDGQGNLFVADFGLATALSHTSSSYVLTDVNTSGTPPYMAPEQWKGQAGRPSDIYALAVMTYQMLTGHLPYQGDTNALAYQHTSLEIPPLSFRAPDLKYPPELDEVIAGGMAKDSSQRTRPASEFYRRL